MTILFSPALASLVDARGERANYSAGRGPGYLEGNAGFGIDPAEILEVFVDNFQPSIRIVIAEKIYHGVRRMVEPVVEGLELFESQARDYFRVATRIQSVGRIREKRLLGKLREHAVRRRIDSLHLVIDNPFDRKRAIGIVKFVMPSFLLEYERGEPRIENRIQVNVDQVVEILDVLAGDRIAGLVGVSEGVEKSLQGTFYKLHERFLHRVFPGTAKDRVLQDMRHAARIRRRCSKTDAEHFVIVFVYYG